MLILLIMILLIFMIVNVLIIISHIISKKTFKDREKNSPSECGFDPKNSGRLRFPSIFPYCYHIFNFLSGITLLLPLISFIKI